MEEKWWLPRNLLELEKPNKNLDYKKVALDAGAAFWRWLIYPFSTDKSKKIHIPPKKGPMWNWGAFIIPELWFLYHEIWGVFFLIFGFYMILVYASMNSYFNIFSKSMLIILFIVRLVAGRKGNIIYYVRHGRWPIAAHNQNAEDSPTKSLEQ